jgi:hypothetical protein
VHAPEVHLGDEEAHLLFDIAADDGLGAGWDLVAVVVEPAIPASQGSFARNSRLKDKPVISAERRSMRCPNRRAQTACVASAPAIANALCSGLAPKSIQTKLTASKVASATI